MIVTAHVKPNSKKGPLVEVQSDGSLVVYVREPAVDGKANDGAIALVAAHFGVPKSRVTIASGAGSRHKRFAIAEV